MGFMQTIDFKNLKIKELQPNSEFEKKVQIFINSWFSDMEKVEVQTSGSTGAPKVFDVEKSRMLASAQKTCNFLELKKGDSALLCLPVEYISGKMMVVRSILRNLKLTISDPSIKPLENLRQEVDFCAMTPLQVENSLDKLHLIKKLIIGGASVSTSLKSQISNLKLKKQIFETYGMSETLSHIGLRQIFPVEELYFKVFDGISISKDDRGCLTINAPELNFEVLQTNDLVEIINEKQFRFLGRVDNVINSGGAKIFPEELEALVKKEIPNEVVFIGIPDEILGQKLVLVVEMNQELRIKNQDDLKFKIQNLEFKKSFHKPKEILFVDEIPRTPNGKVNRRALLSKIMNYEL